MASNSHPRRFLLWDSIQTAIAVMLTLLALLSLHSKWNARVSFWIAIAVNVFAIILLLETALRSIREARTFVELPHRIAALFIFCFLLVTLVCSFANMYLAGGGVCDHQGPLKTPFDAAYFSTVTITTVGYGDYTPYTSDARRLVIWQLGSGVLLLLVALPVLASRLALISAESWLTVTADRDSGMVSIDGAPQESLPFSRRVQTAKKHTITIIRRGCQPWSCELQVSGGDVNVHATLAPV